MGFAPSVPWLFFVLRHGCQMAMAGFLDCMCRMCLALRASGLWLRYATLQNLFPSFPSILPPRPPPWHNPRKGRDQILPSGNIVLRVTCGMGGMGCYLVAFVLITECTTPRWGFGRLPWLSDSLTSCFKALNMKCFCSKDIQYQGLVKYLNVQWKNSVQPSSTGWHIRLCKSSRWLTSKQKFRFALA